MNLLRGNYIDLIILVILIYFASEAFRHGFWILLADFISFLSSLVLSLWVYKYISVFLKANFNLSFSISNALGFLISAIIIESILGISLGILVSKLPEKLKKHKLNKFLGVIPGIGEGLVLIAFLLTLLISFPIKPQIKTDLVKSRIGGVVLEKTTRIEKSINEVFGGVINDTLTYFTVKPNSTETVLLDIDVLNLVVDEKAEGEMLLKVNEERRKLAIPELEKDDSLVAVARGHANDMWEKGYFSHISPNNKDVGDRLDGLNVNYSYAGENLALAPTTITAHSGLMDSDGHRENILDSRFNKIGIGVIDNGFYGKMFVQVFTD